MNRGSRRTWVVAGAVLLTALVALVAATMGIGKPSLPDGAIAFVEDVDNGEITPEEFNTAIAQAAARDPQAGGQAPEEGTPQFNALKAPALAELLLSRWVRGEAEELGIEVGDTEIAAELKSIIDEQFGGQDEFDKFLEDSGLSEEEANDRVELQLLTSCIQDRVIPQDPEAPTPPSREGCQGDKELSVSDDEIQAFYDDNIEQFQTPETRDVRTLLNPDAGKVEDALAQLEDDNSAESWKKVAKQFSTDEATSGLGGLRQGVIEGQNEPALDEAIFAAEEGELVGPIEGDAGFYLVQVDTINAAATQELDEATSTQIRQSLVTQEQQAAVAEFQESFLEKWRSRTVCAESLLDGDETGEVEGALAERCSNFSAAGDGCIGDDEDEELPVDPTTGETAVGCPAFVPSQLKVPPLSEDGTPLPQGPQGPPQAAAPEGAPLGVPGQPGVPTQPGAPPQGVPTQPGAPPQG